MVCSQANGARCWPQLAKGLGVWAPKSGVYGFAVPKQRFSVFLRWLMRAIRQPLGGELFLQRILLQAFV